MCKSLQSNAANHPPLHPNVPGDIYRWNKKKKKWIKVNSLEDQE